MNELNDRTTVQTLAGLEALLAEVRDVAHQVEARARQALNHWPEDASVKAGPHAGNEPAGRSVPRNRQV